MEKSWKIKYSIATKEDQKELYNYDIESFKEIITSEEYKKKLRASKTKPQDYIGKTSGYLQIIDIVPKDKKNEPNYSGTLMYCKCLKCGRPDLIQVRFSYLTENGNYKQLSCGCARKERAFLASCRKDISENFISQFSENFEKFLYVHKMITLTTDKYYSTCPIEEYENAVIYFYNDNNFNIIYNFWLNHKKENNTFYDWAKPSLDHIIPRSKGGSHKLENLQVLTVFENLAKRDLTQEEWEDFKKKTHTTSDYFIEELRKGEEEL